MNRIWMLIAGVLCFAAVLIGDLITDLRLGEAVDHKRGAMIRAALFIPSVIFLVLYKTNRFHRALIVSAVVTIMLAINFSNLFDGFYNVFRGHGWFFTGSEDGSGDAVTDNFYQSIPMWLGALIKVGGSLCTIIIYARMKQFY